MTTYSPMPLSYDATGDARQLKLNAALAERGRAAVCASQAHAWLLLELAMATDETLQLEREKARARQSPITRDKETIVRAVVAGHLQPAEAIELWGRV